MLVHIFKICVFNEAFYFLAVVPSITGKMCYFLFLWEPLLGRQVLLSQLCNLLVQTIVYLKKVGAKQIKITQKNCYTGVSSTPLLTTQTVTIWSKCRRNTFLYFFFHFSYNWVELPYLKYLFFLIILLDSSDVLCSRPP